MHTFQHKGLPSYPSKTKCSLDLKLEKWKSWSASCRILELGSFHLSLKVLYEIEKFIETFNVTIVHFQSELSNLIYGFPTGNFSIKLIQLNLYWWFALYTLVILAVKYLPRVILGKFQGRQVQVFWICLKFWINYAFKCIHRLSFWYKIMLFAHVQNLNKIKDRDNFTIRFLKIRFR